MRMEKGGCGMRDLLPRTLCRFGWLVVLELEDIEN